MKLKVIADRGELRDYFDLLTLERRTDLRAETSTNGATPPGPLGDQNPNCDFLVGAMLRPAANGTVQQSLKFPFSANRYKHLRVIADLCLRPQTTGVGTARQCIYDRTQGRTTMIEMRIPGPSPASAVSAATPPVSG